MNRAPNSIRLEFSKIRVTPASLSLGRDQGHFSLFSPFMVLQMAGRSRKEVRTGVCDWSCCS